MTATNALFLSATVLGASSEDLAGEADSWRRPDLSEPGIAEFPAVLFNAGDWVDVQLLLDGGGPVVVSTRFAGQTRHMRRMRGDAESSLLLSRIMVLATICVSVAAGALVLLTFSLGGNNNGSNVNDAVIGFVGGCSPYEVFAQNRWLPTGAAIRVAPSVESSQVGSFQGNVSISVNGWVHGRAAYPTNVAPFNSDVWFHLADGAGWVSSGGVRSTPTAFDPTGLANGGPPATTAGQCEGAVQ
jgi:hypothetical protein